MSENESIDAAKVGKMFVTSVSFKWHAGGSDWDGKKTVQKPGRWVIQATLNDKPQECGNTQTMSLEVEHGIGQKLAEALLPVIVADASRKAQQLADDSKAMLEALGERTIKCIADMPTTKE